MHPDARTNAPDTDDFFFGDAQTSIAIQWSRDPEMSPYGVLLMNPGTFARKESALLFHPEFGLSRTMLTVTVDGIRHRPKHKDVRVRWTSTDPADPIVEVRWKAGSVEVTELFGLLKQSAVKVHEGGELDTVDIVDLVRQVRLSATESADNHKTDVAVELAFYPNPYVFESYPRATGYRNKLNELIAAGTGVVCQVCSLWEEKEDSLFERFITVHRVLNRPASRHETESTATASDTHAVAPITFLYHVSERTAGLHPPHISWPHSYPKHSEQTDDFIERLFHQLDISRIGLKAVVSDNGRFDASVWQYGYEWGQDAAMVASAATYAGDFELAEKVLSRILEGLSNDQGRIAESSRFRDGELAELNANGAVLLALRDYVALSNDTCHLERHWDRITAIADLPLREEYLHPSGLIVGRRDLWERLPWMGLPTGFDTATNVFCAEGLIAAAELASMFGDVQSATRWKQAGERIRTAMLMHETFSCIEEGRIIHRRLLDGSVQRAMVNEAGYHDERYAPYVPTGVPDSTPRACDPDSTAALPILYGIVDPLSDVARHTLDHLRAHLWDTTGIGGYARSPIASDPDSPGPWAFPTAWIAETELRAGLTERAVETTEWLLKMAGSGGSWFEYYGERESPPLPPIGVIPWGWAQYILLVARGWMGIEFNTERLRIAPRMIDFEHVLGVGAFVVRIEVNGLARATINDVPAEMKAGGIEMLFPIEGDYHVVFNE